MSNEGLIIAERSRDIGGFLVGRLLPFRKKRMVGPFIFIDHMGPASVTPENPFDIGPHPHIGLSTLTYLLEGEILHRDSLGSVQRIKPNEVNWMTAGKGIVHSERVPDDLHSTTFRLHGYQIWVALPKELEDTEPRFSHHLADDLPFWREDGLEIRLVAGELQGKKSPVPVYSELYMLDAKSDASTEWDLNGFYGEKGICVVNGKISASGEEFGEGTLLVSKEGEVCRISVHEGSRILVFGGMPFEEERFIWWNFVSSDRGRIEDAKENWREDRFDKIPGEKDPVPLPGS